MIERIEGAPARLVAFKAVGWVSMDDYIQVPKPALGFATAGGREIRAVFLLGPESPATRRAPSLRTSASA